MADVISLITTDHREMEKLFSRLEKNRSGRPELLHQVAAMLTAHSRAEEERVYPAIARDAGESEEVRHGAEEHHEAASLLDVLARTDPDSADFDEKLHELIDAVKHHIQEEETEILPALRSSVSGKRLNELGRAFDERRRQELSAQGMTTSASGGRSVADRSRAELYQEAKDRGIPGRSTMSKDELAKAVQGSGSRGTSGSGRGTARRRGANDGNRRGKGDGTRTRGGGNRRG